MLKILPIMLLSSAQKLPIMLNIMLININNATVQVYNINDATVQVYNINDATVQV